MIESRKIFASGAAACANILILCGFVSSCKNNQGAQLGSYFDAAATLPSGTGGLRALTGQLDFELPSGQSSQNIGLGTGAAGSNPALGGATDSPSVALNGQSSGVALTPSSSSSTSGQPVTLRMQFSIVLDDPIPSLKDLASLSERMRRVGTLNTFNVIHEPSHARKESEIIGRPLYHSVSAECKDTCIRLVTGQGKLTDKKDVFIIELRESGDSWKIEWFNYFGAEVKNFGLPVTVVNLDFYDGH